MANERTPIPPDSAAEVEFEHDRTCCVCRERGLPTQIHHIDDNPSNHATENLTVLCLTHHHETQVRGGFARHLRADVVRRYRGDWVAAVVRSRAATDALLAARASELPISQRSFVDPGWTLGEQHDLCAYLDTLPELLAATVRNVKGDWDSGVTQTMVEAGVEVYSILQRIWVRLARFFPEGTFGPDPANYLSSHLDGQLRWHRNLIEPGGPGTAGTIVRVLMANQAVGVTANAIEDTAMALLGMAVNADEANHWITRWKRAVAMSGD